MADAPMDAATAAKRLLMIIRVFFARKTKYVDNGWPTTDPDDHAVSELVTDRTGALSPFGELAFPLPSDDLPYLHPVTVVNR